MNKSVYACVLLLIFSLDSYAGEPPFPEGLGYPNVIRPDSQFGTLGTKLGLFNTPRSVSYNTTKQVFCVADTLNNRIQLIDLDGNPSVKTTKNLYELKVLNPQSVDCRDGGKIVIADTGNRRIIVVDENIEIIPLAIENVFISGVLKSSQGGYLITDNHKNKIFRVNDNGDALLEIGGIDSFSGQPFSNILGVDEDKQGNIYISDSDNSRIVKLTKNGKYISSWGTWGSYSGNLAGPAGISISGGKLFVADQINHRIQAFDLSGTYLFQWARHPSVKHGGNGRVHYPYAISSYDEGKKTVVCEPFEHRCQVFSVSKAQSLVAVNDSAWWHKATKFHYGTKVGTQPSARTYQLSGFKPDEIPSTNIFSITEPDTHATLVFDYSEDLPKLISAIGGYGKEKESLIRPSGVGILPNGSLFISDAGNKKINFYKSQADLQKISINGAKVETQNPKYKLDKVIRLSAGYKALSDTDKSLGMEPGAIDIGPGRSVYALLPKNKSIVQISENGVVGNSIPLDEIVFPTDFEFSPDMKSIYVVDHYGYSIINYDLNGKIINKWGGAGVKQNEFTLPFGIAISDDGRVYVSDVGQNRIKIYNLKGQFQGQWGSWGAEPGEFYKPKGLDIDREGRIIVTDFGNHRGQLFNLDGVYLGEFGIGAGYKAVLRP